MVIVITGDGKGKTTSSIGQSIRALGAGKRVFFIQFIKGEAYPSGEDGILKKKFGDQIVFRKAGKGFVGILGDKRPFSEHQEAARNALEEALAALRSGTYDLIVLDEVNVAVSLKLIDIGEVLQFAAEIPAATDVIFTGRNADTALIAIADLVTECQDVKHPYQEKVPARKGIEY